MAANYRVFSKAQFEYELKGILARNRLGVWNFAEITSEISSIIPINEYVYSLPTRNPSVQIILFSSVDSRTGKTREKGSDAVRVVLRWKTRSGNVYKRIGKHLRVETLFANMERTILSEANSSLQLNYREFVPEQNLPMIL